MKNMINHSQNYKMDFRSWLQENKPLVLAGLKDRKETSDTIDEAIPVLTTVDLRVTVAYENLLKPEDGEDSSIDMKKERYYAQGAVFISPTLMDKIFKDFGLKAVISKESLDIQGNPDNPSADGEIKISSEAVYKLSISGDVAEFEDFYFNSPYSKGISTSRYNYKKMLEIIKEALEKSMSKMFKSGALAGEHTIQVEDY